MALKENVMVHLQSARDEGIVSAAKIYGDLRLQAAVRLITAGNYARRERKTYQYLCQHLLEFYGVPESLARMDWAFCVEGDVSMTREEVKHQWTPGLARALVLRAWALEPHQIHLSPEGVAHAKKVAIEWDEMYSAIDLPLHTGAEKYHSIIRTAIAIANMCYSHPDGRENECEVRMVHILWAIAWIEMCWHNLEYDDFSHRLISARTLTQPFQVERVVTVDLGLDDPEHAAVILARLTEANGTRALQGLITGCRTIETPTHYAHWLGALMLRGAVFQAKAEHNKAYISYVPTAGFLKILHRLIDMARNDPQAYVERYQKIDTWKASQVVGDPSNLEPLDEDSDDFHDATPF
jgi:hypothetical protein